MKPHPRFRKTVKWCGVFTCLLLASTWLTSIWWTPVWTYDRYDSILITNGSLWVENIAWHYDRGTPPTLQAWPTTRLPHWWPAINPDGPYSSRRAVLPLWVITLPALLLTAFTFRLDALARRRAISCACPSCGYNLTGLPPGTLCPECGSPRAAAHPATHQLTSSP